MEHETVFKRDEGEISLWWFELTVDTFVDIIHKGVRGFLQREHDKHLTPHRYK